MTPTAMFGRSPSKVRPTAMAHWPTRISLRGAISPTGSGFPASIFNSTSIREWSVATTLAGLRVPSGKRTRIEAGSAAKLNALEMM